MPDPLKWRLHQPGASLLILLTVVALTTISSIRPFRDDTRRSAAVAVQAPVAVTPAIETVQARPAAIRRSTDGAPPSEEQRRALMLVVLRDLLRERPFGGFSR